MPTNTEGDAKMTENKVCSRCGRTLPISEFTRDNTNSADGYKTWCKDCNSRAHYERKFPDGVPNQVCIVCGVPKPLYAFRRDAHQITNLSKTCKECEDKL